MMDYLFTAMAAGAGAFVGLWLAGMLGLWAQKRMAGRLADDGVGEQLNRHTVLPPVRIGSYELTYCPGMYRFEVSAPHFEEPVLVCGSVIDLALMTKVPTKKDYEEVVSFICRMS